MSDPPPDHPADPAVTAAVVGPASGVTRYPTAAGSPDGLTLTWHGRGQWSVPLAKGLHRFVLTFADARAKDIDHQRIDLWNTADGGYPQPRTVWRGVTPLLEVSCPGMERQALPDRWLKRAKP